MIQYFKLRASGVIINENSNSAFDFRVESDGEDEAIFLDASANELHINKGETDFTTLFTALMMKQSELLRLVLSLTKTVTQTTISELNQIITTLCFLLMLAMIQFVGGHDTTNHKDGFAVFNDFNGTTFENKLADGQFGSGEVLRYSPGADDTLTAGYIYYLNTNGQVGIGSRRCGCKRGKSNAWHWLGGSARTVGCLIRGFIRIPSTEILNVPGSVQLTGCLFISD